MRMNFDEKTIESSNDMLIFTLRMLYSFRQSGSKKKETGLIIAIMTNPVFYL